MPTLGTPQHRDGYSAGGGLVVESGPVAEGTVLSNVRLLLLAGAEGDSGAVVGMTGGATGVGIAGVPAGAAEVALIKSVTD